MPFGLCNAPATFQILMDMVLAGVKWSRCLVYINDIIVLGESFHHHLLNLRVVMDKLREAGLKMKLSKCAFFRKEVLYLGHKISCEGISTDSSKVDVVNKWSTPATVQELQKFLGLAGYYKRYVKNFAGITKPLYHLTEKGRDFQWMSECAEAFGKLKALLVSALSNDFIVDTNASNYGSAVTSSQWVRACCGICKSDSQQGRMEVLSNKEGTFGCGNICETFQVFTYVLSLERITVHCNGCIASKNQKGKRPDGWRCCKNLISR